MTNDDRQKIAEITEELQRIRTKLDDLAQKLSPVEGFAEHHSMIMRMYTDSGYVLKRLQSRVDQLK